MPSVLSRGTTISTDELRSVVERAARRDPDAWAQLYRYAYRRLYTYCRRRLPDDQTAEDAASETMTRAMRNIDKFTWRGAGFDGWLYGIARNVVLELVRSRGRVAETLDADLQAADERGPEELLLANDESDAVRSAFDRLDPEEREVLELRVHDGLTSEAVGRLLGKRPGAVRMAQARALRRMRIMLVTTAAVAAVSVGAVAVRSTGNNGAVAGEVEYDGLLAATSGGPGTGRVRVVKTGIGRVVELQTDALPILPTGSFYEVWFVGPADTPADRDRISAGTFHPDQQGRSDVQFAVAVDPSEKPYLVVTVEPGDGDPRPNGTEVLRVDLVP